MGAPLARAVTEPSPPERDAASAATATLRALVEQLIQHARETVVPAEDGRPQVVLDLEQMASAA